LALLALIIIVIAVLLLSRCGGGNSATTANSAVTPTAPTSAPTAATSAPNSSATAATSAPNSSPTAATSASGSPLTATTAASSPPAPTTAAASAGSPVTPGSSGSLSTPGTSLLPLAVAAGAGGDLTKYIGQPATATAVMVLSAPVDNGFWVGTSTTDRVWVALTGPGLVSPHPVHAGDHLSFTEPVVANDDGFAHNTGLTDQASITQLTAQKAHIALPKTTVTFND